MIRYRIVHATEADAINLAQNMCQEDKDEIYASAGMTPLQGVLSSMKFTDRAWAVRRGRQVLTIFGVAPTSDGKAMPWMLTSKFMRRNTKALFELAPKFVQTWLDAGRTLCNFVDARNTKAIRFLRILGFTIYPPEPYGVAQLPFHRFEKVVSVNV